MPIDRATLEGLPEPTGRGPSVVNIVLEFLEREPDQGYSYKELREALNLDSQRVSSSCKRLAEANPPKIIRGQDEKGVTYVAAVLPKD